MIQVVNRAFDILEIIARDKKKIFGLSEIADELSLNHATCANIMKTMVDRNYLEQVGHKKGYKLGFMAFRITENNSFEKELTQLAVSEMEKLTRLLNETTLLGILRKNIRIALHQVSADHDLNVKSKSEKDAYTSATGRLLIASLSDADRQKYLEKYGLPATDIWREAASLRGFIKEVNKIQQEGYCIQVAASHIVGMAVPVYSGEDVIASLSVFLPESRFGKDIKSKIEMHLKKTAAAIGDKLHKQR